LPLATEGAKGITISRFELFAHETRCAAPAAWSREQPEDRVALSSERRDERCRRRFGFSECDCAFRERR
jgi:hypothetical protein